MRRIFSRSNGETWLITRSNPHCFKQVICSGVSAAGEGEASAAALRPPAAGVGD